eukprot:284819493_2
MAAGILKMSRRFWSVFLYHLFISTSIDVSEPLCRLLNIKTSNYSMITHLNFTADIIYYLYTSQVNVPCFHGCRRRNKRSVGTLNGQINCGVFIFTVTSCLRRHPHASKSRFIFYPRKIVTSEMLRWLILSPWVEITAGAQIFSRRYICGYSKTMSPSHSDGWADFMDVLHMLGGQKDSTSTAKSMLRSSFKNTQYKTALLVVRAIVAQLVREYKCHVKQSRLQILSKALITESVISIEKFYHQYLYLTSKVKVLLGAHSLRDYRWLFEGVNTKKRCRSRAQGKMLRNHCYSNMSVVPFVWDNWSDETRTGGITKRTKPAFPGSTPGGSLHPICIRNMPATSLRQSLADKFAAVVPRSQKVENERSVSRYQRHEKQRRDGGCQSS